MMLLIRVGAAYIDCATIRGQAQRGRMLQEMGSVVFVVFLSCDTLHFNRGGL